MKSFQTFSGLESHLDVGDHCVKDERPSETLYDKLRRDWADRFTTSSTSLKMNRLNLVSAKVKMFQ